MQLTKNMLLHLTRVVVVAQGRHDVLLEIGIEALVQRSGSCLSEADLMSFIAVNTSTATNQNRKCGCCSCS